MTKPYGLIYKVTNKVNGKSYIGQTTLTLAQRWACHLTNPGKAPLTRAIRKYGREAFSLDTITRCADQASLDAAECFLIEYEGTKSPKGYNLKGGGSGGGKQDDETCARHSEFMRAQYRDPAARQAHAEFMRGIWTPEVRARASASHKKRCEDPAERARMAGIAKAHWATPGAREAGSIASQARWTPERRASFAAAVADSWRDPERRAVREAAVNAARYRAPVVVIKDGIETRFRSQREAAQALGVSEGNLSAMLRGKGKTLRGYTFRKGN